MIKQYSKLIIILSLASFAGIVLKKTYDAGFNSAVSEYEAEYARKLDDNYKRYEAKIQDLINDRERYWSDRLQREVAAAKEQSVIVKTVEIIKNEIPTIETTCSNVGDDAYRLHVSTRAIIRPPGDGSTNIVIEDK